MPPRVQKPKKSKGDSTVRRHGLADFVELYGDEMPTKCTPCKRAGRICRVHINSGRCGACNASNSDDCDIRVTASEFRRLAKERTSLQRKLKDSRDAVSKARDRVVEVQAMMDAAQEGYRTALAKEDRLMRQMEQNERRAGEAISVEERGIQDQEMQEFLEELDIPSFEPYPFDDRLIMAPAEWEELLSHSPVAESGGVSAGGLSDG